MADVLRHIAGFDADFIVAKAPNQQQGKADREKQNSLPLPRRRKIIEILIELFHLLIVVSRLARVSHFSMRKPCGLLSERLTLRR